MKKIVFILLVIAFIIPSSIFAEKVFENEVRATLAMTLSTFGVVFISSMFGDTPEGITVLNDETSGTSKLKMELFNPAAFFEMMAATTGSADGPSKEDFPFETMTGAISADGDGNMYIDMKYIGGSVKTMKFETAGENITVFTANGKDYSYIENILNTN